MAFGSRLDLKPGSLLDVVREVLEGTLLGIYRAAAVFVTWTYANIVRNLANIIGVHLPEGKREKIPGLELKVAAVGFGRTGTYSLTLALEELGLPTLHTMRMYSYENEEIFNMWSEKLVAPAFEKNEPIVGTADMKLIAESGYLAVADLPCSLFYEQILEEFPDCKFILTTRENSEDWFRSWAALSKSITTSMFLGGFLFPKLAQYSNYIRWLHAVVNKDASYLTSTFPKDESIKENAIASYEEHNRHVRELIPAGRLLEYNVKEGWGPLCKFLEIDECPTTPFPKANSARSLQAQCNSAFWAVTIFLLLVVSRARRALTQKKMIKSKME